MIFLIVLAEAGEGVLDGIVGDLFAFRKFGALAEGVSGHPTVSLNSYVADAGAGSWLDEEVDVFEAVFLVRGDGVKDLAEVEAVLLERGLKIVGSVREFGVSEEGSGGKTGSVGDAGVELGVFNAGYGDEADEVGGSSGKDELDLVAVADALDLNGAVQACREEAAEALAYGVRIEGCAGLLRQHGWKRREDFGVDALELDGGDGEATPGEECGCGSRRYGLDLLWGG